MEYKQYMIVEKGYSHHTINYYLKDSLEFINYCITKHHLLNIEDINKDHVHLYFKDLYSRLSPSSINRHIASLKSFYRFLVKEGKIDINIMSSIKPIKKEDYLPVVLNEDEIQKLLNYFDENDPISLRNKCMIEVLYASGLRVSEMCSLTFKDINLKKRLIKCIGKGNKERIIPINKECCVLLQTYLDKKRSQIYKKESPYLFINKKGEAIHRDTFYHMLKKTAKQAGITKEISPHTLRHTFATHMLNHNADLRSIQEMLGHSDISTTTIYTHVSHSKLMDEYRKFDPGRKEK